MTKSGDLARAFTRLGSDGRAPKPTADLVERVSHTDDGGDEQPETSPGARLT